MTKRIFMKPESVSAPADAPAPAATAPQPVREGVRDIGEMPVEMPVMGPLTPGLEP